MIHSETLRDNLRLQRWGPELDVGVWVEPLVLTHPGRSVLGPVTAREPPPRGAQTFPVAAVAAPVASTGPGATPPLPYEAF